MNHQAPLAGPPACGNRSARGRPVPPHQTLSWALRTCQCREGQLIHCALSTDTIRQPWPLHVWPWTVPGRPLGAVQLLRLQVGGGEPSGIDSRGPRLEWTVPSTARWSRLTAAVQGNTEPLSLTPPAPQPPALPTARAMRDLVHCPPSLPLGRAAPPPGHGGQAKRDTRDIFWRGEPTEGGWSCS